MFALVFSILIGLVQTPAIPVQTGTVIGIVKFPEGTRVSQQTRVALLPSKYIEIWNKQVQQRLDNYWEIFKPELAVNRERFSEISRMAQSEAFTYVASTMRRDLGEGASRFMKTAAPNGQFEFKELPLGTYQALVQIVVNGQEVVWSKPVQVQSDIPVFVDLGKPVS